LCADLCVLSIYKKEAARAWGWQRSPNKNKKAMLPQALHLLNRREVYKTIKKNCLGFGWLLRIMCRWLGVSCSSQLRQAKIMRCSFRLFLWRMFLFVGCCSLLIFAFIR